MDLEKKKRKNYITARPSSCLFIYGFAVYILSWDSWGKISRTSWRFLLLCVWGVFLTWCHICWTLETEWEAEVLSSRQAGRKGSYIHLKLFLLHGGLLWIGKAISECGPAGEIIFFLLPYLPIECPFHHCLCGGCSDSSCQHRTAMVATTAGPANAAFSVNNVFCGLISLLILCPASFWGQVWWQKWC